MNPHEISNCNRAARFCAANPSTADANPCNVPSKNRKPPNSPAPDNA
ncbi:hypothetical protein [Actinoallomurus sp. NPDC050550]